ncbi:MAG: sigma-54 dependent transcriptional regulator [Mariprofundaceae bacterium]
MADILLVEDEANARQVLTLGLESRGHMVTEASGPDEARELLESKGFDIVLTDLRMDGHDAGIDVVRMAANHCPRAKTLLLTAYASAETAVEAMKLGAFDYLTKPVSAEELGHAIERALASKDETSPERHLTTKDEVLVGESMVMQRVRERLLRAASKDFTVLITGESGTGKELAARFVHKHSTRGSGPFVPVHCGAIPEGLFESELFGHCKGSFTGADSDRSGLIESADGGILFLDEVGEMPLAVQVKLLRVLQDMKVRRVGEESERKVDVRIVAATNRDLGEAVKQEAFREDLFYRLNVVPIHMPPLRQRREDIPALVESLLTHWGGDKTRISDSCMHRLSKLPLLGNVRELENLLQRLIALSEGDALDETLLDDFYPSSVNGSLTLDELQQQGVNLDQALESAERQLLSEALQESKGNATKAAGILGISFRSIRYRLKKLGMKEHD